MQIRCDWCKRSSGAICQCPHQHVPLLKSRWLSVRQESQWTESVGHVQNRCVQLHHWVDRWGTEIVNNGMRNASAERGPRIWFSFCNPPFCHVCLLNIYNDDIYIVGGSLVPFVLVVWYFKQLFKWNCVLDYLVDMTTWVVIDAGILMSEYVVLKMRTLDVWHIKTN